jgi:acetoin utilization deacetylase AcuC-like enzyme
MRQELEQALSSYPILAPREADYKAYGSVHSEDYLDKLILMAADRPVESPPKLSMECWGYEYCLPGYLYGLGGMFEAIDQMKQGTLERAFCFCLGGHHGHRDWGHGYCLLNPLAAAARYAQSQGFGKIAIIDWDIHHGDGTQSIFANDPTVYCLSIHSAADLYMSKASGLRHGTTEAGKEAGHCNIPLLHEIFNDNFFTEMRLPGEFYRAAQSLEVFQTGLTQIPFTPDLIFIFAGSDSHKDDCGAGITNWEIQDFERLTQAVLDLAGRAGCPVLSSQGGGYNLAVNIPVTVKHVEMLAQA